MSVDLGKKRVGEAEITTGSVLPSDGSTQNNKTGGWRAMRPVTDHGKCAGSTAQTRRGSRTRTVNTTPYWITVRAAAYALTYARSNASRW